MEVEFYWVFHTPAVGVVAVKAVMVDVADVAVVLLVVVVFDRVIGGGVFGD